MATTSDRNDPAIHEVKANGQNENYLVLPDEELAKGYIRPLRYGYVHTKCGVRTKMGF